MAMDDDWELLTPEAAERRLAPLAEQLLTPDPFLEVEADPEVFGASGMHVAPAIEASELTLGPGPVGVLVDGDLIIHGTLRQDKRAAPLLVLGDLRAKHVVSKGCIAVMGDLKVSGVFYGGSTNFGTHVFGETTVETLLLQYNHHFLPHHEPSLGRRVNSEEDGDEAVEALLHLLDE